MNLDSPEGGSHREASSLWKYGLVFAGVAVTATVLWLLMKTSIEPPMASTSISGDRVRKRIEDAASSDATSIMPRKSVDSSGFAPVIALAQQWDDGASLEEIRKCWDRVARREIARIDEKIARGMGLDQEVSHGINKATFLLSEGLPEEAYDALQAVRAKVETRGGEVRSQSLATLIFLQGVAGLRRGENENCIMCRGESSCILPISAAAVHLQEEGSRLAILHFTEYLRYFPKDLEVRWLLNVAHMTLGEHPEKVDPSYLVSLDSFNSSEVEVGRFRDVGHLVGLNRFSQGGGSIMEDFDNDGLLDVFVTSWSARDAPGVYRNSGDGRFEDRSPTAGVSDQFGGLVCYQTDYNNDGLMDILILRGAWLSRPVRPTLLRNDGDFRFTDVTIEAGVHFPINSTAAAWADFDNDGWLDLFIACERQDNRLYRNLGNGAFEEVAAKAGVAANNLLTAKGCNWIDFDNDDYPDLFVNHLSGKAQLFGNNRDGTFSNVTESMGIDGPFGGFSCWSWDYDNDGWLDIFATCYDRSLTAVVQGLTGQPHGLHTNRLFRNLEGQGFQDVAMESGLDMVFATMGSNFGDFNNDGFLDMYLGTGEPGFETLIPNRLLMNIGGRRFAEATAAAGVGHLQKGHGVSCGDWDRDGSIDIFIQMGGAVDGDRYHDILFQNPGQTNAWLNLKLVGKQTNRAAFGARIKIVTAGESPLTIHRHVTSGSSFGGNPMEQTIGLGRAKRIAELEIRWPTSGTTQVFRDLQVNQAIRITELENEFQTRPRDPLPLPLEEAGAGTQ